MAKPDLKRDSPHVVGATRTLLAKTCFKCGEFKQGSEFNFSRTFYKDVSSRVRKPYCKACVTLLARKFDRIHNHASWDNANNRFQPWTQRERDALYVYIYVGYTHEEIAAMLGRSVSGITHAWSKLKREEWEDEY